MCVSIGRALHLCCRESQKWGANPNFVHGAAAMYSFIIFKNQRRRNWIKIRKMPQSYQWFTTKQHLLTDLIALIPQAASIMAFLGRYFCVLQLTESFQSFLVIHVKSNSLFPQTSDRQSQTLAGSR